MSVASFAPGSTPGSTGVFTTDLSLVVRSWDPWLVAATGIPEADACGRPLEELVPDLESRGHLARFRHVAESGAVEVLAPAFHHYLIACAPRTPSAHFTRMQQHVTIAPLRAGEAMVGVSVTIHDVTARRERERDLAARLKSGDEGERLQAVRALDADAWTVEPLTDALGDASWRVRRAAAEHLARTPDDAAVDALVAAVRERHRDAGVLNAAITALRKTASSRSARDVMPPLLALLADASSDADVRTYVALALGLLEDPRAVPALVTALGDADANVRYHAIEALGRIGSRAAAAAVATVAESRDFSVAFAALDTLAMIGEPSVAERIVPLLDDDMLCAAAADALGRLGGEEVAPALAATLGRPGAPAGALALALARLHARLGHGDAPVPGDGAARGADRVRRAATPAAIDNVLAELSVAPDDERHGLVVVLGWLDGEDPDSIVGALAGALAWPRERRLAGELLAHRGTPAVPALLDALGADDEEQRKAAAAALGRIGAVSAVPVLVPLLDDSAELAVVAAGALGGIGGREALEPLLAHLDHPHAAVRQAVVAALCSIGHPDMPGRLAGLLAADSPRVRESGAKIAGYFGDAGSLATILALTQDPDESVRRTAVEQLVYFEHPDAVAALASALALGTPGVRAAAARALAHVGASASIDALLRACRDADPWVRYYAARSAGHLGAVAAVPTLVSLASWDAVPPVRIAAIEALAEIGDVAGLQSIAALARDPDPAIPPAVLLAFGKLRDGETVAPLLAALTAGDHDLRMAALAALALRGGGPAFEEAAPDAADVVAELARDDSDPEMQAAALDVLVGLDSEGAVAALVELAGEPHHAAAAVAALARLDGRRAEWIARGLESPEPATRCAIVDALSRLRPGADDAAVARLVARALKDDAEVVRLAATAALARLDLRAAEGAPRARRPGSRPVDPSSGAAR